MIYKTGVEYGDYTINQVWRPFVYFTILDLGGETSKDETFYQRCRKLTKLILSK